MAGTAAKKTGLPGITIHDRWIRVAFKYLGNRTFLANQMGHNGFSMVVNVYAHWIDTEPPGELDRIWKDMQNMSVNASNLPQREAEQFISDCFI